MENSHNMVHVFSVEIKIFWKENIIVSKLVVRGGKSFFFCAFSKIFPIC